MTLENKDYGLGKCFCGKYAIIGMNGNKLCEKHMIQVFSGIGSELRKFKNLKVLPEKEAA